MARNPLYKDNDAPETPNTDSHKGLWYERFFNQYADNVNWEVKKPDKTKKADKDGKQIWIEKVKGKCGDETALKETTKRQIKLCNALDGKYTPMQADWYFATGLGNPHPVENGFAWHPILGVPYLTGAAVKGLVRAWVEEWEFGKSDEEKKLKKEKLHRWFGSEDKDPTKCELGSQAGNFIFFDALPIAPVTLKPDVMTPHMGKWYDEGGEPPKTDGSNVPADWHSPVPVYFLVADKPQLLFTVAPRTDLAKKELDGVMAALAQALKYLGAGAKTAVGYGRMESDEKTFASTEAEIQNENEELQRQKEWKTLTPLEKEVAEMLYTKTDKNIKDYILLLQKLESGYWSDNEVKKQVAEKIKSAMQKEKTWSKPKKDKDYKRTLTVMQYLSQ